MRSLMKTNIIVSSRGQLTLPSEVRKKYGINEGSVLVVDDRDGEIILRPATVMEVEYYTDDQIEELVAADSYKSNKERELSRAKLMKLSKAK